MEKVCKMAGWHGILKEKASAEEKIFSICERRTDIIAKGKREAEFGRKVQTSGGKSNLILGCEIMRGNPKDSELYKGTIEEAKKEYGKTPETSAADGGYASGADIKYAKEDGIVNIVFNKAAGSMGNVCTGNEEGKPFKEMACGN
jgi:IS5 family transposase